MPQQNIHTSRSSKKSLPSSSLTRHCNDMSPAVDRTRVSSESWYLLVWWMSWDDLNSCDLQKVWPWWFSNLGARPYTVLALDNCCQIGQMPQFRVLIVRYGASKPCCLQLACLCPITFLDLAWHATLRPAPPPRPNGQHVMYLTRFMRDKVCACVNVCVGRALRTLHLERGIPLFTSSLAVPRKYESHLRSPTGMQSTGPEGYKRRKPSALGPTQNTKQFEAYSEKPSG